MSFLIHYYTNHHFLFHMSYSSICHPYSLCYALCSVLFASQLFYVSAVYYKYCACWGGNSSVQISHWILPENSSVSSSVSLILPLIFGPITDHQNSILWNLRTSIHKGKAHTLKPTSSNFPPSCLVPRLVYAPPLLSLSSEFVRGTDSDKWLDSGLELEGMITCWFLGTIV